MMRAGRPLQVRTRVHNLSTRPFAAEASYGRRLVRLGAQLCTPDGALINRDYARAGLSASVSGGGVANVAVQFPPLSTPGRFTVKFDLVSEGVDWFERCGSEPTFKTLWVR